jgi:arylsulfatase A-like enzyme
MVCSGLFWIAGGFGFLIVPILTLPVASNGVLVADWVLVFILFLTAVGMLTHLPFPKVIRPTVALLVAGFYTYMVFANYFERKWGLPFSITFLTDPRTVWKTVAQVVGLTYGTLFLLGLMGVFLLASAWWYRFWREAGGDRQSLYGALVLFSIAFVLRGVLLGNLFFQHGYFLALAGEGERIGSLQISLEPEEIQTDESIFVLQLESLNSLAANGELVMANHAYEGNFIPVLRDMAKDGVFFSHFFNNTYPTQRAQGAMLCGELGHPTPSQFPYEQCLPHALVGAGYRTIVFRSDDLSFQDEGRFLKRVGFEELHNRDIMKPHDRHYSWGYNDCLFYTRAFEYLRERYPHPEKLFVYFEVSSHHPPYRGKPEYAHIDPFPAPNDTVEHYLNSLWEQDYCMRVFDELYEDYARDDAHLFIAGDHSVRMGLEMLGGVMEKINTDRFLTSMAYIPPREREEEFARGKVVSEAVHSHTDFIPTVLELITGKNYPNSLAFELFSKTSTSYDYDDCHLLSSMLGGPGLQLGVVRGDDFYRYAPLERRLYYVSMEGNLMLKDPVVLRENLSYEDFSKEYFCDRYQGW